MGMKRATTFAAAAVAVVLAASACGPSDYKASDTTQPAGAAADAAAPAAGPGNQPGGQLAASTTEQLGPVLTDSAGLTLYRFDKDTAKPPKSNCEGDCAKTWPVVAAGDVTAPAGMDPSLLGEVVRGDGSKQLTVDGWPVYRFNKDAKPGDVKGQGVGGVWFAFGADGKKAAKGAVPAEAAPAPASPAPAPDASAAPAKPAPPAEAPPADAAAPAPGLSVAKDPKLGEHIVDGNGMTVYRFKKDSAWPMVSNCVGDCLAKWPVVPPVDKANAKGITQKNFSVLDRPDGQKQQTVDCWPIYTFSGDKKPGDTNGQGVGGTWYAVSPDGKPITIQ
ncbi:SCO0930 family lipoprotein [Streptomyces sp. NPDC056254]|uniref:SCO0930 family lipoprotein n=1 Tax=Streptomyces sp. NPDC056254 TaxID=3345763 RepID=UPI0035DA676F